MGGKDAGKKSKENGVKTSPDESLGMSSTERILRRIHDLYEKGLVHRTGPRKMPGRWAYSRSPRIPCFA
jgi:hypothetical protein